MYKMYNWQFIVAVKIVSNKALSFMYKIRTSQRFIRKCKVSNLLST